MVKTKKWIIWIVIIVAVIGSIVWYVKSRAPKTTYTTATVERGDLAQTVSVTGDLVANEEITLNFELGGRVGQVFVKESDRVAAGDKIATLINSSFQKQVDQARAALDQAVAIAGGNSDTLREAKVSQDNADNTLSQTKDLNDRNVAAAKQAVDNAQKYYDDAKDFYGSSSSAQEKLTLTAAKNSLDSAKKTLEVAEQQANLAKINAENAVDSTKAKVKTVESQFTLGASNAQVAQARAAYDLAVLNLNKATLVSPVNGIITEVNNKPGEILGTGVIKETFSRVMSLDMIIESKVPESDITKLTLGQHAKVTFDALPADVVTDAEVIEIDPASTVVQDVVYYKIKLSLSNVDQRLKPGMSANIDVKTAEKNKVLMIPMRAVKTDTNNQKTVDVLQADGLTVKTVKVETGLQGDDGMVEITKGINEGDKVVTFTVVK